MAVTPTITVTQPGDSPPRLRITINNGASTGAINQIWRSTSAENLGAAWQIGAAVAYNGTFDDFNVASGVTYNYYVVADDGTTATSLTVAGSITLGIAYIHAVTKSSATGNAVASTSGWAYDQSHSRNYRVDSVLRLLNNSGGPHIGLSTIEEGVITIPAIIPKRDEAVRVALKAAYLSRAMLCLRTALGDKWFGRLSEYSEQQSGINFLLNLNFEILQFTESVT